MGTEGAVKKMWGTKTGQEVTYSLAVLRSQRNYLTVNVTAIFCFTVLTWNTFKKRWRLRPYRDNPEVKVYYIVSSVLYLALNIFFFYHWMIFVFYYLFHRKNCKASDGRFTTGVSSIPNGSVNSSWFYIRRAYRVCESYIRLRRTKSTGCNYVDNFLKELNHRATVGPRCLFDCSPCQLVERNTDDCTPLD